VKSKILQSECRIRRITNRHFVGITFKDSDATVQSVNDPFFANIDSLHQQTPNRNVYRSGFLGVQPINCDFQILPIPWFAKILIV
jgi:hypothetical protein